MEKRLDELKIEDINFEEKADASAKIKEAISILKYKALAHNIVVILPNEHRNLIKGYFGKIPMIFGYKVDFDNLKKYNENLDFIVCQDNEGRDKKTLEDYTTKELLDEIRNRI